MKNNSGTRNPNNNQRSNFVAPVNNHNKFKKNKSRLGGSGLSLQAFANAKSKNDGYNPALIKKQREFYKNAKYVSKYKKLQKQPNQGESSTQLVEDRSENKEVSEKYQGKRRNGKKTAYCLDAIYSKKREEEERARMEKEAIFTAKKEEKEKSEFRRKTQRENMLKRTKSGQPVMKYRLERLLQTIQGSTK
ncbi:uncharacterized protein [Rutidosis leptorrhynchoides]|uniref:uncharacterized protein n=1 Tax=Rutidosis leptorrhynchoides TaxID=125765 RepID=UPI003A990213